MMQDVIKNYKTWLELGKRQRYFVNTAFTRTSVAKTYEIDIESVNIARKNLMAEVSS